MAGDFVFDVVVIGAGLAGHVSALSAAEAGASVCLLEKGAEYGGSSTRAGGGLVFAGTDLQRAAGIMDTSAALRADIVAIGRGKSRPELVDAYVDNQLETYEWLRASGVKMTLAAAALPGEVVRAHLTGQGVATRHLHDRVLANGGIAYHASAEARRLTRAPEGPVSGLQASVDGTDRTLTARSAVVLASGGFARSTPLLQTFAPQWVNAVKMSGPHNSGDGMRMAWALGADLSDMAYVEASFGASIARYPDLSSDPDEEPILLYPNNDGAIIVNLDARRFGNENLNYKVFSGICAEQPEGIAFQIFDEPIFQKSDSRATPMDYKGAYAAGLVKRAESITALAQVLDLDPSVLQETVDHYNAGVDRGVDPDYGRPVKGYADAGGGRIGTAPFYGFPTRPGLTTTYAGVTVDRRMQVIDVFGAPIPGLYAAGEVVGGFHGGGYYSGTALGKAAVFGRISGREAVFPVARFREAERPE